MQPGNAERTNNREIATLVIRLTFFALTLVPLAALLMPWVTLDGTGETHSGIATLALAASSFSIYLYDVDPLQAATLTMGPAIIVVLAMVVSYYYHRRKSIYWAPPMMLGISIFVAWGTTDLVISTHAGLITVMGASALLVLHQILIRVQVAMQRRRMMPNVYRTLAVATGIGYYRWRET